MSENENESHLSNDYLESLKSEISDISKILNDPTIEENPAKVVDVVRKKLTELMTKKARIKAVREEISKMCGSNPIKTLEEITKEAELNEIKLEKQNKELQEILNTEERLKKEVEEANRKRIQYSNIMSLLSQIDQINQELIKIEEEGNELNRQEKELIQIIDNNNLCDLKNTLDEEKKKRLNIQNALDSLKTEENKRLQARELYINDKKETLLNQLNQIENRKKELILKQEQIKQLNKEISRYKSFITRHERRKCIFDEEVKPEPIQINKPRIGRLIMLLLSDGPNESVIKNLGEELKWTKAQTKEFYLLAKNKSDNGIGSLWANWLEELSKD